MRVLSWIIILLFCIVCIGGLLYFLPITRDLVINVLDDLPIISSYVRTDKTKSQIELFKENIEELQKQVKTLTAKLKEVNSELELAKSQLKERDKLISNLKMELESIKSETEKRVQNIKKLAGVVENMDAKSAAKIIEEMDEKRAVEILLLIDKEKVVNYE